MPRAMQKSKKNDNKQKRKVALPHSAPRQKRNERFLEELANFRYGNTEEGKKRYNTIGEKFSFWRALTDEQKRSCAIDRPDKIRGDTWNIKNGITISDEEKEEFLEQRLVLDNLTFKEKFECLVNAQKIEKTRVQLIEDPLEAALAKFPTNFIKFDVATRDVPESDYYIRAWFDKKAAERQEKTSETSDTEEIQIIGMVSRTPLAGSSSTNPTISTAGMRDELQQAHQSESVAYKRGVSHPNAGNSYGNVPQNVTDVNQVANENEDIPSQSLSPDGPPSSRMNTTRQATKRSQPAAHNAAPKPKAAASSFGPTQRDATVGRHAGEQFAMNSPNHPIEMEYDAPQALATSPVQSDSTNVSSSSSQQPMDVGQVASGNQVHSSSYARTMNAPTGIYNEFPQGIYYVPDYSNLSSPRRENQPSTSAWHLNLDVSESNSFANLRGNCLSSSSQPSTSSLPNTMLTDTVTHQKTLSVVPPPRMTESIMKKVSNEMNNREESGNLNFGPIQVRLTATGKELDDTIAFLNNLKAQLESAKQKSYQQL
ncbi:hypothetical protein B9Z55_026199 [Caenorhabditis nigoni]|uniref:Uncharacterized protein n=1 Tax=Caenorhabditis nigoni TaxID=1611254 RepID=A0A2G5T228_9PELO|nr:hypothetical protein B9Z55_026199 [Caenorhabditis nigoni]